MKKQVTLEEDVWKELIDIKYSKKFKTLNDVIKDLLSSKKRKSKK